MALPAADGIRLLEYARVQNNEERLFLRWIQDAQYSMGFDEFRQALTPVQFEDEAALMADVKNILKGGRTDGNI